MYALLELWHDVPTALYHGRTWPGPVADFLKVAIQLLKVAGKLKQVKKSLSESCRKVRKVKKSYFRSGVES